MFVTTYINFIYFDEIIHRKIALFFRHDARMHILFQQLLPFTVVSNKIFALFSVANTHVFCAEADVYFIAYTCLLERFLSILRWP